MNAPDVDTTRAARRAARIVIAPAEPYAPWWPRRPLGSSDHAAAHHHPTTRGEPRWLEVEGLAHRSRRNPRAGDRTSSRRAMSSAARVETCSSPPPGDAQLRVDERRFHRRPLLRVVGGVRAPDRRPRRLGTRHGRLMSCRRDARPRTDPTTIGAVGCKRSPALARARRGVGARKVGDQEAPLVALFPGLRRREQGLVRCLTAATTPSRHQVVRD